jgi:AbrB family looped-hinge helix DNA binding protein
MTTVRVSPKFQVVIPLDVRRALRLKPGQKLQVLRFENRIELIPVPDLKTMRGFARGIDTSVPRDKDRV